MNTPARISSMVNLIKGGGFSLPAFMAGQSDGFWYDFTRIDGLFQGADEATPVTAFGDVIGRVNDRRTGANSPRNATQATTSFRPKHQAAGATFDAADDNLLTAYTTGAAANFVVAKIAVPASLAGVQVIAGAQDASAANKFWLGLTNVGLLRAGVGTFNDLFGTTDLRGQTVVVGLTCNGLTLRLYAGAAQELSAAQTGTPTVATPLRLGALSTAGATGNFFGGSIKKALGGRQFLDLATFNNIANAL